MMNDLKNGNKIVESPNKQMKVVRRGQNAKTTIPQ
jgi:hypothetical protein